ncbi:MAG TPA: ATP synthase subunit I [Tissierellaceae bacterium]|nr:ATP synthase subunit I [Tissierellaceae bacterium]
MNNDLILAIYKRVAVVSLLVVVISYLLFSNSKPIILGYIFGTIISMLGLKLIDNTVSKSVKMSPAQANRYTVFHYFLRYLIYFIVLFVAAVADYLNVIAAVLGLMIIKLVIIISTVLDKDFMK